MVYRPFDRIGAGFWMSALLWTVPRRRTANYAGWAEVALTPWSALSTLTVTTLPRRFPLQANRMPPKSCDGSSFKSVVRAILSYLPPVAGQQIARPRVEATFDEVERSLMSRGP